MTEIRMHGRGGQGVVKSAHIIVSAIVESGGYAHFIPFFGVERKGSPVYGFLRIDNENIRLKCQVYNPEVLMILDDTLLGMKQTFEGLQPGGVVILNSKKKPEELTLPEGVGRLALIDASGIATAKMGRNIPNTAMLGAFARVTELVDWQVLQKNIVSAFGEANRAAALEAYDAVRIIMREEVSA